MNRDEIKAPEAVTEKDLPNIQANSKKIASKSMELTDTWGAMFVMDDQELKNVGRTLGFSEKVCDGLHKEGVGLNYVNHKANGRPDQPKFTWHGGDSIFLTLRGFNDLDHAMQGVTDETLETHVRNNSRLIESLMEAMPAYARNHMFSPEVAARVLGAFGATVTPNTIFELGLQRSGVCQDLQGRQGIPTQFIRALSLSLAAKVQGNSAMSAA